jgi:N-acyl-D-amino-acid deacylase
MQGVTTEIGGNCGFSAAPVAGQQLKDRIKTVGSELDIDLDWESTDGYFSRLENQGISINYGALAGHNTLRGTIMGFADRAPTAGELDDMKRELEQAVEEGALGLSTGLIYPPACFAGQDELIELCRLLPEKSSLFTCHIRSEGDQLIEALKEVIAVGEAADVSLQISHLKTSGRNNWGKLDEAFQLIEQARARGVDVTCDRYPYLAGNTVLYALLPSWALEGDMSERTARLKGKQERERAVRELETAGDEEDYWERVMISQVSSEENRELEGLTLQEAAALRKEAPAKMVVDLFVKEEGKVEILLFSMCEENLRRILTRPYVMVASDAGARTHTGPLSRGKPHPRGFATFVRAIVRYSGDEKLLSTAEMIRKCSSMPCDKLGIKDRGRLIPGCYADIVLFDPEKLADTATFQDPIKYPQGIRYVIVNGKIVVEEGRHTGARAGRVLRSGC